jgi:cell division protein FtsQ
MAGGVRAGSSRPADPRAKFAATVASRNAAPPKAAPRPRHSNAQTSANGPNGLSGLGGFSLSPVQTISLLGGVLVLAGIVVLVTGDRPQKIASGITSTFETQTSAMGFKVRDVHVQGTSGMAQADVIAATGLYQDEPILTLDLKALQAKVEAVGWVKSAKVVRLLPDTLVIAVVERQRLAVWQNQGQTRVVDVEGKVIQEANPANFSNLPLVVGVGANEAAPVIMPMVLSRPRLVSRLEALVRVDQRRWDLRLKDGGIIQLPAVGEDSALIQLDQIDQKSRILDLGFERIDLRNPEALAVRPRAGSAPDGLIAGGA